MNEAKLAKSPATKRTTELHEGPSIVTTPSDKNLTEDLPVPIEKEMLVVMKKKVHVTTIMREHLLVSS